MSRVERNLRPVRKEGQTRQYDKSCKGRTEEKKVRNKLFEDIKQRTPYVYVQYTHLHNEKLKYIALESLNTVSAFRSLLQMDELKCRKRVLRRLGYCNASDVIDVKGRVACELST